MVIMAPNTRNNNIQVDNFQFMYYLHFLNEKYKTKSKNIHYKYERENRIYSFTTYPSTRLACPSKGLTRCNPTFVDVTHKI